jgi:hypothetical protein
VTLVGQAHWLVQESGQGLHLDLITFVALRTKSLLPTKWGAPLLLGLVGSGRFSIEIEDGIRRIFTMIQNPRSSRHSRRG